MLRGHYPIEWMLMADIEKRHASDGAGTTPPSEPQVSYKELVEEAMGSLRGTAAEESLVGYLRSDSEISRYYRNEASDSQRLFSLIQQYRGTATRLLMSARESDMSDATMRALSDKLDKITEMAQRLFGQVRREIETERKSSDDTLRSIYDALYNESNAQDDGFDDMTDSFDVTDPGGEHPDADGDEPEAGTGAGDTDGDDTGKRSSTAGTSRNENGKRARQDNHSTLMLQTVAGVPVHTTGSISKSGGSAHVSNSERKRQENIVKKVSGTFSDMFKKPFILLMIAAGILLLMFCRPYMVPSGSMIPTLVEGDRILSIAGYFVNGETYQPGDIVCFIAPSGETYVKRVVANGGDHVLIAGDTLYVNGEESPYQGNGTGMVQGEWDLADDEYFMMGDNRSNSQDSRYIGPIQASKVLSKVVCIYLPLDHAGAIS